MNNMLNDDDLEGWISPLQEPKVEVRRSKPRTLPSLYKDEPSRYMLNLSQPERKPMQKTVKEKLSLRPVEFAMECSQPSSENTPLRTRKTRRFFQTTSKQIIGDAGFCQCLSLEPGPKTGKCSAVNCANSIIKQRKIGEFPSRKPKKPLSISALDAAAMEYSYKITGVSFNRITKKYEQPPTKYRYRSCSPQALLQTLRPSYLKSTMNKKDYNKINN